MRHEQNLVAVCCNPAAADETAACACLVYTAFNFLTYSGGHPAVSTRYGQRCCEFRELVCETIAAFLAWMLTKPRLFPPELPVCFGLVLVQLGATNQ